MKKLITRFVSLFTLTFTGFASLHAQGCPSPVNLVTNGDFSAGNTGFASGLNNFTFLCTTNEYIVGTDFANKCGGWTNGTGNGQFMIVDGPTGGGAINIWSQVVPVCPNTDYTFSYSGQNVHSVNLFPVSFSADGTTFAPANLAGGSWNQYSWNWNSGPAPPLFITIALTIPSGDHFRDFGIDDIFFGYCNDMTVSPPVTICQGTCTSLTANATGATTYYWSDGSVGSTIVVCPGVSTSYTVTATDALGCIIYGSLTTSVTVNASPTVTATASPSTLTPPSLTTSTLSTTVSGGSGFTYSWSPASTLSNATVANPVATPTTTTVYTVTVTNASHCTATATVQVTVAPQCLCTLPYDYIIPAGSSSTGIFGAASGATGKNIKIFGVFTVNGSFNFTGCNIVMEPSAQINVASGCTLTVAGQTHIYTCDGVWKGINLLSGSDAQIVNSSVIEDAEAGVTLNTGSTATIVNCIFNRNHTAVKVLASTSSTSPLSMQGCVVTCRNLQLSCSVGANPLAPTVWTNIVANVYSGINLKSPFYGYRSIYGVTATDVNKLQLGNTASPTVFNGFDTLMAAGIHLTRTNAVVYNNKFRHLNSTLNPYIGGTPLIGTGVYAIGTTTAAYSLKVGGSLANQPNDFYNVNTSVDITRYTTNQVLFNTILNTSSTVATWGGYGKFGIRITPSANNTVTVTDNSITNAATGILVNRSNTSTPQTVSLTINNNVVGANPLGFCNTGISLTDPTTVVTLSGTVREINNNIITKTGTCINLSNVKNKVVVYFNSCQTLYNATANINGIKLSNCANVDVLNNHTKSTTTGTNINSYGIYLLNSASNTVRCNTMEHATRSLVFSGNCTSLHAYTQNTMKTAQAGIVLLLSGTLIGTQGTATTGVDNYWEPSTVVTHILNNSTSFNYFRSGVPLGTLISDPSAITGPVAESFGSAPSIGCTGVPARLAQAETETTSPEFALPTIVVYPNPNNGIFSIACTSDAPKDVYVYDMNGRIVYSNIQTTETILSIDISSEAKGLYLVKVVSGENVQTEKISNQ